MVIQYIFLGRKVIHKLAYRYWHVALRNHMPSSCNGITIQYCIALWHEPKCQWCPRWRKSASSRRKSHATNKTSSQSTYLPPLAVIRRLSDMALYEAAGRSPAVAWLRAFPVSSKRSPGAKLPSAWYQRPLGSQTYGWQNEELIDRKNICSRMYDKILIGSVHWPRYSKG